MSAPIKLLFIIDFYKDPFAGAEGQLLKLINGLEADKFEVTLVVFRESEYLKRNKFPVSVDVIGIQRLSSPRSWLKLFNYFVRKKSQGCKLAHLFLNDASIICPPLLKLLSYKVVISRLDMGFWFTRLNLPLLKFNTLFVDRVVANGKAVKEITVLNEGYKTERVIVIYNGYLESSLTAKVGSSINQSITGFDDKEIRIVLVANIRLIKRMEDAIRAIHLVRKTNQRVVFYIIGGGDQSQLIKLAESLGITSAIRFLGSRDDVQQLLPAFHVGILCSESEGFSNTLIEYMQAELPVVCSDVGGNPEIIEQGVNGFLYEVGDIQALSKYLIELADDAQLRAQMGHAGMKKVKDNYNLIEYVEKHQHLYEELLLQ